MLSVGEVAKELDLSESWIRKLLESGKLVGSRVGSSWVVDSDSVFEFKQNGNGMGRRWTSESCWALLSLASGDIPAVSNVVLHRCRKRLAEFGLEKLASKLSPRAERRDVYIHPSLICDIVADGLFVGSGVSSSGFHNLVVSQEGVAEGYVKQSDFNKLCSKYSLIENPESWNLRVSVVSSEHKHNLDGREFMSWPVVAIDLFDALDSRSVEAGRELVNRKQNELA